MKITVLLSRGIHPVSGRACPATLDAQAISLALGLGVVEGLHAGAAEAAIADYLGHGLPALTHLVLPETADPLPALTGHLRAARQDLILAGRQSQGGEETGLLPYRLAQALDLPMVADAVGLAIEGDVLTVDQALPRGARRRLRLKLPCLVTVHPAAPPPLPFALGQRRRGRLARLEAEGMPVVPLEEVPYRPRPKLMVAAQAAERRLMLHPSPAEAATAILDHLRGLGLRR
ncbi:electron transfer flavoprotein subunit beta [Zavarzinia sp.]|uniref:electron transfer flavoprotein subunit beta n=1 Tax=Zavarzinia sp. TaxID=2027920 RepID=UPI003565A839